MQDTKDSDRFIAGFVLSALRYQDNLGSFALPFLEKEIAEEIKERLASLQVLSSTERHLAIRALIVPQRSQTVESAAFRAVRQALDRLNTNKRRVACESKGGS